MTGKGLSGGLYPIAATLLSARAGAWLEDDGWSNVSTFGGSELGCRVARAVLAITTRPETTAPGRHPDRHVRHRPGRHRRAAPRMAGRGAPGRPGDRAALRPSHGRDADDPRLLRRRHLGDVRRVRPLGAAVQARPADVRRRGGRGAGPARGRDRRAPRHRHPRRPRPGRPDVRPGGPVPQRLGAQTQEGTPDDEGTAPADGGARGRHRPSRRHQAVTAHASPTATTSTPSSSDTERRLDPANPESGGHVKVLAYGEISAALTTDELPGLVCKRMAGYPDEASVSAYLDLVDEYLTELAGAGHQRRADRGDPGPSPRTTARRLPGAAAHGFPDPGPPSAAHDRR